MKLILTKKICLVLIILGFSTITHSQKKSDEQEVKIDSTIVKEASSDSIKKENTLTDSTDIDSLKKEIKEMVIS